MYKNAEELIKNGINLEQLLHVHSIINLGEGVYQDIINMQSNTFSSVYFKGVLPRIRCSTIYTQFEKNLLTKDFPFECRTLKVNNFGYSVPELTNNKVIFHIARTRHNQELPNSSAYRRGKALLNNFIEKQFLFPDEKSCEIDIERYYVLITYGGKDSLEFINLIVPDNKFKDVLAVKDLTNLGEMFKNKKVETDEDMRKRRMKLKQEVMKKIQAEGV